MEIQKIQKYDRHGCNFAPKPRHRLGLIEYSSEVTNHEFNGAYGLSGLYEKLEQAREIAKSKPGYTEVLAIPDIVFFFAES